MTDSASAGLALVAIVYRLYLSGQQRKAASNHEAPGRQPPKADASGARIEPAGAIPGSRNHALGWTVVLIVAVAAAILALKGYPPAVRNFAPRSL